MTKIEWTDVTWNPVAGCSVMSAGCTNCYAMKMAKRLEAMGVEKYRGLTKTVNGNAIWTGAIKEDHSALGAPLNWKKPKNIFVNSMSDLFHADVTESFIAEVWQVMGHTPHHNYQILTKRPDRMLEILSRNKHGVLPNVWLGTSVENSDVISRIDYLRDVPAAIRFISFEPLIGDVGHVNLTGIGWAIVGGESGHKARPMHPDWARSLRDQCKAASVPFFFKQWGAFAPVVEYPSGKHSMNKVGKKRAGRLLDGVEHNAFPEVPPCK
ncbi:phage Gp37/Gp68 family protein [Thalassospira xiamenensis]|uniref:phage Gp37/Gp68 family protein n=1 Tax=Thalassospira xiamenensis TaxID=220697 RepID=UPI003AA7DFE2